MNCQSPSSSLLFGLVVVLLVLRVWAGEVDCSEWTRGASVSASQEAMVSRTKDQVAFDSLKAFDSNAYRWGGVLWDRAFTGDFSFEADFAVERLDHWNSVRLSAESLEPGRWKAVLVRGQEALGHEFLRALVDDGGRNEERKLSCKARHLRLGIARQGGKISFTRVMEGRREVVATLDSAYLDAVRFRVGFDSPASTGVRVRVENVGLSAETEIPAALAPAYAAEGPLGDCSYLATVKASRLPDGSYTVVPGGKLIFAAEAPITAAGWKLKFKSEGFLKIKAIELGSAETIQLSDAILWDDIDAKIPEGYADRSVPFAQTVRRFPTDLNWRFSHVTTSGIFFFEVTPAGEMPIRFGEVEFLGRAMRTPPPLSHGVLRRRLQELPVTLSAKMPSVEIPLDARVGAMEIVHFGGPQKSDAPDTLAGWLFVYADGSTAPAFATMRWNCGVNGEHDLEWESAQGGPDGTWFGPPGFGWGEPIYSAADACGTHWSTKYRTVFCNPHPDRKVVKLQVFQTPGDVRTYTVCSVKPIPVEDFRLTLVEPAKAAFTAGEPLEMNVYEYGSGVRDETRTVSLAKDAGVARRTGEVSLVCAGRFAAGTTVVTPSAEGIDFGPVRLVAGDAQSSRCSLMPPRQPDDKPFYYTMIGGMYFPISDFDRQRRLGYDSAKVHVTWKLDDRGEPDFTDCTRCFDRIVRAGLDIAVRNDFDFARVYTNCPNTMCIWKEGTDEPFFRKWGDCYTPFYRERLVDYYTKFAKTVAKNPHVVGINANYGQRQPIAKPGGGVIYTPASLAALAKRVGRPVTPADIAADPSLFSAYSRLNEEVGASLIDDVARGIRSTGCNAHLTFNVNFHPVENKTQGQTFGEYLRLGFRYPPGSLFHETSERYSLSFVKWMAAARTCGLPYGDECCQPPPTYEHAMFAYMWMGMMQSFESNYCQWWGGRPGCENLAQLKAYHKLLFDAEYLPDPVCLALSLQTGHAEISKTYKEPFHTVSQPHYGLAHFLRELNVNPDRYMIDEFPQFDGNVKSRLLIDDVTRAMPTDFADRIERFIRAGGVFLASPETDVLNGHAFLRRLGIEVPAGDATLSKRMTTDVPFLEKEVGKGKVVLLLRSWRFDWDPGRPDRVRREMLSLLSRLGEFAPQVQCSHPCVFTTPYRAKNGDILISAINITCEDRKVDVSLSRKLVAAEPRIVDLGTGLKLNAIDGGDCWRVKVDVPKINTTVLRVRP